MWDHIEFKHLFVGMRITYPKDFYTYGFQITYMPISKQKHTLLTQKLKPFEDRVYDKVLYIVYVNDRSAIGIYQHDSTYFFVLLQKQ